MKLRMFLYLLLRDHVTFGDVEKILQDVEKADGQGAILEGVYLSAYVEELKDRLND